MEIKWRSRRRSTRSTASLAKPKLPTKPRRISKKNGRPRRWSRRTCTMGRVGKAGSSPNDRHHPNLPHLRSRPAQRVPPPVRLQQSPLLQLPPHPRRPQHRPYRGQPQHQNRLPPHPRLQRGLLHLSPQRNRPRPPRLRPLRLRLRRPLRHRANRLRPPARTNRSLLPVTSERGTEMGPSRSALRSTCCAWRYSRSTRRYRRGSRRRTAPM